MATAEELLAQMEENPELYADSVGPVNDVIVINAEERTIELPESEKKFGTESDKKSERKHFKCPRIVGDNIDLSTLNLSINFKNANNEADIYPIEDVEVDGDYITFSWLLSKKVTAYKTDASENQLLSFIFCAKSGEDPDVAWNTTLCSDGVVLEGLEPGESIAEDNPDIIQYILERLESAGTITPEQISEAVEGYFASNPIEETDPTVPAWAKEEAPDKSLTQEGQAADAKEVGNRLSELSDEIGDLGSGQPIVVSLASDMTDTTKTYLYTGTEEGYTSGNWYYYNGSAWVSGGKYGSASGVGWTPSQITLLETIGEYLVFKDATTGQAMFDSLIASLRSGSSGSDEPDTPVNPDEPDVPDTPTSYTITNSLVNVTTDNEVTSVEANGSYTANLTPDSNYYIDTVTITMGGVNVTDTVYADGVITITEVTGNIVIVANGAESDNLIVLSECGVGNLKDGTSYDGTTMVLTPYIEVNGNTTYQYNMSQTLPDGTKIYNQKFEEYTEDYTKVKTSQIGQWMNANGLYDYTTSETTKYIKIGFSTQWTNPYFGISGKVV